MEVKSNIKEKVEKLGRIASLLNIYLEKGICEISEQCSPKHIWEHFQNKTEEQKEKFLYQIFWDLRVLDDLLHEMYSIERYSDERE